jgi:hypothetical protein
VKKLEQARDLLKEAFEIPDDDSLKISRNLELIFLHNNRREIPIPPAPEEPKEVSFLFFGKLFLLLRENKFSNFSCMFLNPNNFFQFEF